MPGFPEAPSAQRISLHGSSLHGSPHAQIKESSSGQQPIGLACSTNNVQFLTLNGFTVSESTKGRPHSKDLSMFVFFVVKAFQLQAWPLNFPI